MSSEYEEFIESSKKELAKDDAWNKPKSDRVSWRKAWSLFYKFMILQIVFTIIIWSGIAYYGLQSIDKWEAAFDDEEDSYAKYDECITEKLLNDEDISNCDKYSPD